MDILLDLESITIVRFQKMKNTTYICWLLKLGHVNITCSHTHKHMSHLVQSEEHGAFKKTAEHVKINRKICIHQLKRKLFSE